MVQIWPPDKVDLSGGLAKTEPASHHVQWREGRHPCSANLCNPLNCQSIMKILEYVGERLA